MVQIRDENSFLLRIFVCKIIKKALVNEKCSVRKELVVGEIIANFNLINYIFLYFIEFFLKKCLVEKKLLKIYEKNKKIYLS